MYRPDQLNEGSRSLATDRLRRKAARSLRISIAAGLLAAVFFALTAFLLLACFLARANPFAHPALVLYLAAALPATPLLALASWAFSLRHETLLRMAKEKGTVRDI
jgi:hypothetical protein